MSAQALQIELKVVETFISALKGSGKAFISTSGGGVLGDTGTDGQVDESYPSPADHPFAARAKSETIVVGVSMPWQAASHCQHLSLCLLQGPIAVFVTRFAGQKS